LRGAVACAFGCPFEGEVPVAAAMRLIEAYAKLGFHAATLGDTTAWRRRRRWRASSKPREHDFPSSRSRCHFHNTAASASPTSWSASTSAIFEYESSIAGLGGCPFAPGATGNSAPRTSSYLLEESGFDTGIDLDALIEVARTSDGL
jgi:hydroxymethylglutaryl-CoA lyase